MGAVTYDEDGDVAARVFRSRLDRRVWVPDIVGNETCFEHPGGLRAVQEYVEREVSDRGRTLGWGKDGPDMWLYNDVRP